MNDASARQTAFQFAARWNDAGEVVGVESDFRTDIHPESPLQYPDSAYWYLRCVQQGFVPTLQEFSLFPEASLEIINRYMSHLPHALALVDLLQKYNKLNYPKVCDSQAKAFRRLTKSRHADRPQSSSSCTTCVPVH
jgi:hypothetical protein